jgi:hypothetical protein
MDSEHKLGATGIICGLLAVMAICGSCVSCAAIYENGATERTKLTGVFQEAADLGPNPRPPVLLPARKGE